MAAAKHDEPLRRATAQEPCPICGGPDWCAFTSYLVYCMRCDQPKAPGWKVIPKPSGGWVHVPPPDKKDLPPPPPRPTAPKVVPAAPVQERDSWYRTLLGVLTLSPEHQLNLLNRGLDQWGIQVRGYRTLPATGRLNICKRVLEQRVGEPKGIPGFYQHPKSGSWLLAGPPGLLIPIRDRKGRIQAFQIRRDPSDTQLLVKGMRKEIITEGRRRGQLRIHFECETEQGQLVHVTVQGSQALSFIRTRPDLIKGELRPLAPDRFVLTKPLRYVWMSSANKGPGGSSPGAPLHIAQPLGDVAHEDVLWITEGPLKADVLAQFSGDRVIAQPGVNVRRGVLDEFQATGARWAIIAHDMDEAWNKAVAQQVQLLIRELEAAGIKVCRAYWDPQYKGIDDALAAGARIGTDIKLQRVRSALAG